MAKREFEPRQSGSNSIYVGFDVRERVTKDNSRSVGLSHWKDGLPADCDGDDKGRTLNSGEMF